MMGNSVECAPIKQVPHSILFPSIVSPVCIVDRGVWRKHPPGGLWGWKSCVFRFHQRSHEFLLGTRVPKIVISAQC